jgi:hypothetical protein
VPFNKCPLTFSSLLHDGDSSRVPTGSFIHYFTRISTIQAFYHTVQTHVRKAWRPIYITLTESAKAAMSRTPRRFCLTSHVLHASASTSTSRQIPPRARAHPSCFLHVTLDVSPKLHLCLRHTRS